MSGAEIRDKLAAAKAAVVEAFEAHQKHKGSCRQCRNMPSKCVKGRQLLFEVAQMHTVLTVATMLLHEYETQPLYKPSEAVREGRYGE